MTPIRLAFFLAIVLLIWSAMHGYVFWRLASVPWVADNVSRGAGICVAVALAASFPLARLLNAKDLATIGRPLEFFAANWVGVVFLLFSALLTAGRPPARLSIILEYGSGSRSHARGRTRVA